MFPPLETYSVDRLTIEVHAGREPLAGAAARHGASLIRSALRAKGGARIIVATGNSQTPTIAALASEKDLDWSHIEVFHMDEYCGLPETHPASFRLWIKTHLADVVHPGAVYYLAGDAPDAGAECRRYAELVSAGPIDVCFLGFGENGHIAFNDPHAADFGDPLLVKPVALDERCRIQQVGEGHFPDLDAVPNEALTLTCPALMAAGHLVCSVPEQRKAEAVRTALQAPIAPACPASLLRTHPRAVLYLDRDSASLLEKSLP